MCIRDSNGTKWHLGGLYVYNLAPMSNPHFKEMCPRCYSMIERGVLEPGKLVTHTAYFEDLEAMDTMFQRACEDVYKRQRRGRPRDPGHRVRHRRGLCGVQIRCV